MFGCDYDVDYVVVLGVGGDVWGVVINGIFVEF